MGWGLSPPMYPMFNDGCIIPYHVKQTLAAYLIRQVHTKKILGWVMRPSISLSGLLRFEVPFPL